MQFTKLFSIGILLLLSIILLFYATPDNKLFGKPVHIRVNVFNPSSVFAVQGANCVVSTFPGSNAVNCGAPVPGGINCVNHGPGFGLCGPNADCWSCFVPPNCNTGVVCGGCNPQPNTCFNGNGTQTCTYTAFTGGGACKQVSFNQACTVNNCFTPRYTCVGGNCVPWYSVSGRVYDPKNGSAGVGGVAVHLAGQTTTTNGNGDYAFNYAVRAGSYTVSVTVPFRYLGIVTSRSVTVGPDRNGVNFRITKLFRISGRVTDKYNNNKGVSGVSLTTTGANGNVTEKTDNNGNYLFDYNDKLEAGNHTVTLTIPNGYTNTTVTSRTVNVGPNQTGVDFGITKLFTLTGDIFVDPNINGLQEGGEINLARKPNMNFTSRTLAISKYQPNITTRADGSYTINNLITGNVTVSYLSLPAGYYMTSPLNGPPPSFRVAIGFGCSVNGAPGARCNQGDINNLNFGTINDKPWLQAVCGDIRDDNGFSNSQAVGQEAIITNASCPNPGIVFTGDTDADFGKGKASNSNQVVGGFQYPEVYNSTGKNKILTSYDYLLEKAKSAKIKTISLSSVCTLSNCKLPQNLAHGVYTASNDVSFNAASYTFPTNQDYIFLIDGKITFNGNIHIPTSSSAIFASSGNMIIPATMGSAPAITTANLEGIYSTDKSLLVQKNATKCADLRLNIGGAVYVNAAENGGGITDSRNLCRFNALYPMLQITQRLDLLLHIPEFVRNQQVISQEVAP